MELAFFLRHEGFRSIETILTSQQRDMAILELGLSQQAFFDIYFEKRFFFKAAAISEFRVTLPEIDRAIYSWEPTDPPYGYMLKVPRRKVNIWSPGKTLTDAE